MPEITLDYVELKPVQANKIPTPVVGNKNLFLDVADNTLKQKDSTGALTTVGNGGPGGSVTVDQSITQNSTNAASSAAVYAAVNTEFTVLSFSSTVTWNNGNKQQALAKLTATGSFTLNLTNVKSGGTGLLKIITNTASAITITFDSGFTHKSTNTVFTTYQLPASSGQEYFLQYISDGSTLEWLIVDNSSLAIGTVPTAKVTRAATQSIAVTTLTPISWDTENFDTGNLYNPANPTQILVPGSGNKLVTIAATIIWAANANTYRRISIAKNGVNDNKLGNSMNAISTAAIATIIAGTFLVDCVGGDILEVNAYTGTAVDITTAIAVIKVESR